MKDIIVESKQKESIYDKRPFENIPEDNLKAAIEAVLFSTDKPISCDQIRRIFNYVDSQTLLKKVLELKEEYEQSNRGIRICEVAGGFQMIASPHFSHFLRRLYKGPQNQERLSQAAMETLAIIAYKQPISKSEIEVLRKVNIDGVIKTLQERNLIRVLGHKKTPGRPKVYGTTRVFLEYFGLNSLEELPKMEKFPPNAEQQQSFAEQFNNLQNNKMCEKDEKGTGKTA
ncbi:MAG: SMC-Scp complex subunit ScpB [Candidatus Omnitrophica bacterium]|nr:SMC-Scp complex subunit ScpB [Candidatus Omnitrophota bacterium]